MLFLYAVGKRGGVPMLLEIRLKGCGPASVRRVLPAVPEEVGDEEFALLAVLELEEEPLLLAGDDRDIDRDRVARVPQLEGLQLVQRYAFHVGDLALSGELCQDDAPVGERAVVEGLPGHARV